MKNKPLPEETPRPLNDLEEVGAWIKGDLVLTAADAAFYGIKPGKDFTTVTGEQGRAVADAETLRKMQREIELYCNEIDSLTKALRRSMQRR